MLANTLMSPVQQRVTVIKVTSTRMANHVDLKTHGSRYHRRPGSLGAIINRVFKGMKLPGRMGNNTRTIQNLKIVRADVENNVLLIKGNVPGANKSFIEIKSAVRAPKK